jgi:hypothetical protein
MQFELGHRDLEQRREQVILASSRRPIKQQPPRLAQVIRHVLGEYRQAVDHRPLLVVVHFEPRKRCRRVSFPKPSRKLRHFGMRILDATLVRVCGSRPLPGQEITNPVLQTSKG